jgi:hypothetical protein
MKEHSLNPISIGARMTSLFICGASLRRAEPLVLMLKGCSSNVDVDDVPGAAEHAYRLDAGDGPRAAAPLAKSKPSGRMPR